MMDFLTDDMRRDPYPLYEQVRSSSPLLHMPQTDMWMLFDYESVKRAMTDSEAFSSIVTPPTGKAPTGSSSRIRPGTPSSGASSCGPSPRAPLPASSRASASSRGGGPRPRTLGAEGVWRNWAASGSRSANFSI